MQEDTAQNLIRVNVNMVAGAIGIIIAFATGIAWGVRLESKTQENERRISKSEDNIAVLNKEAGASLVWRGGVDVKLERIITDLREVKTAVKP